MYGRITNTTLDVFATPTREYVGRAKFTLSSEDELKLLNLLNYNVIPDSLLLLDVVPYETSIDYVSPILFKNYRSEVVIRANVRISGADFEPPVEIRLNCDIRGRQSAHGAMHEYNSMELSNIELLDIKQVQL